jgi:hypothetical protein
MMFDSTQYNSNGRCFFATNTYDFSLFSYAAAPFAVFLCANLAARELGFNI